MKKRDLGDQTTIHPYDYDFISYEMLPEPELFELRQVLAIPKEDIEG